MPGRVCTPTEVSREGIVGYIHLSWVPPGVYTSLLGTSLGVREAISLGVREAISLGVTVLYILLGVTVLYIPLGVTDLPMYLGVTDLPMYLGVTVLLLTWVSPCCY